jgi:hypothetical protein
MNSEDKKKLEACMEELADILYRNTSAQELESFEGIENAIRNHWLETVGPNIGFFYQNQHRDSKREEEANKKHHWPTDTTKKTVGKTRNVSKKQNQPTAG